MHRNLDMSTLRTLLAIVDTGGMTRAANRLHMTQSAVSMQIKRLEQNLSLKVLERVGRAMQPTPEGEQLVGYAQRLIDINDEAIDKLTLPCNKGTITFGVPYDLVHPHIPAVLKRFGREYPRMSVSLSTGMTADLRKGMRDGHYDLILTTELKTGRGAIQLLRQPLVWTGAHESRLWKQRPLPLALTQNCIFRKPTIAALEKAGIDWFDAVNSSSDSAALVASAADLGIRTDLMCAQIYGVSPLSHAGELPKLPKYRVLLYLAAGPNRDIASQFGEMLMDVFQSPGV